MPYKRKGKSQNSVTIEDVARLANVSVSTVSRVLNNGIVSEKTRQKVNEVLKATNYSPNAIARSLRGGKTHTIGIIVPDITNPFFTNIINELGKMYKDTEYSIIVCNTFDDPKVEQNQVDSMLEKRVDGLLVTSSNGDFAGMYEDINTYCPVVLVDRVISTRLDSVRTDNVDGAMHAVSYLITKGRRRILAITGPQNFTPGQERYTGYLKALELYNIPVEQDLIQIGDFTTKSGYELTKKVLEKGSKVDAIFAANNFMGAGAIQALKAAGCRIPDDIALIMFDDLDLADVVDPPITVVAQSIREIGMEVGNLMLNRIRNTEVFEPKTILIKSRLEIRKSV